MDTPTPSQADKLGRAAGEAGCDEDEARWDERLKRVAGHKPPPEKPVEG